MRICYNLFSGLLLFKTKVWSEAEFFLFSEQDSEDFGLSLSFKSYLNYISSWTVSISNSNSVILEILKFADKIVNWLFKTLALLLNISCKLFFFFFKKMAFKCTITFITSFYDRNTPNCQYIFKNLKYFIIWLNVSLNLQDMPQYMIMFPFRFLLAKMLATNVLGAVNFGSGSGNTKIQHHSFFGRWNNTDNVSIPNTCSRLLQAKSKFTLVDQAFYVHMLFDSTYWYDRNYLC